MSFNFDIFNKKVSADAEEREREREMHDKKRVEIARKFISKKIGQMDATESEKAMLANLFGSPEHTEVQLTETRVYFVVTPKEGDKFAKFSIGVHATPRDATSANCRIHVWFGEKKREINTFGERNIVQLAVRKSALFYVERKRLDEQGELLRRMNDSEYLSTLNLADLRAVLTPIAEELEQKHGVIRPVDDVIRIYAKQHAYRAIADLRHAIGRAKSRQRCYALFNSAVDKVTELFGEECPDIFDEFAKEAKGLRARRVAEIEEAERQLDAFCALLPDACERVAKNKVIAAAYLERVGKPVEVIDFNMANGDVNSIVANTMYTDEVSTGVTIAAGEWQGRNIGIVMDNVNTTERRTMQPVRAAVDSLAEIVEYNLALVEDRFALGRELAALEGYDADACKGIGNHVNTNNFRMALGMYGHKHFIEAALGAVTSDMAEVALGIMAYFGINEE